MNREPHATALLIQGRSVEDIVAVSCRLWSRTQQHIDFSLMLLHEVARKIFAPRHVSRADRR